MLFIRCNRVWCVLLAAGLAAVSLPGEALAADNMAQKLSPAKQAAARGDYGKLPMSFEANRGQADARVRFLSRGNGYGVFLTDSSAVLALGSSHNGGGRRGAGDAGDVDLVTMRLGGLAGRDGAGAEAVGEDALPGRVNYFIGNDPSAWRADLPTYAKVRLNHVYPGIDLVYYGNQRELEYDFVVAPGASARPIRLVFDGQRRMRIDAHGDLVLSGAHGAASLHKPVMYQMSDGVRREVSGSFKMLAHNMVGFTIGSYDRSRALVIDPVLEYSTYLGGSGISGGMDSGQGDQANGITVDSAGQVYVVGTTYSINFPVTGSGYQTKNKVPKTGSTVFVSKLSATGASLIFSTFLGGTGIEGSSGAILGDFGYGIAIDSGKNVYVTGATYSTDFPVTAGTVQTVNHSAADLDANAFVAKLGYGGNTLAYSTYLGGADVGQDITQLISGDAGQAIAVDASGDAYVTGYTRAPDFPTTTGAFQAEYPGAGFYNDNAFVSKLNPHGTALLYSTYLGGGGSPTDSGDSGAGIAIDSSGNAYVAGRTFSTNFPVTSGAFQTVNHAAVTCSTCSSAFVTKLNPSGTAEVYSTYFGSMSNGVQIGVGGVYAVGVAVDSAGETYIAGFAETTDLPVTAGVFMPAVQGQAIPVGFAAKLNATGTGLVYATYFGGGDTTVNGLAADSAGNLYLTGRADQEAFPATGDAVSPPDSPNSSGAFVAKLNATGTALQYSTPILPETEYNYPTVGYAVAVDGSGNAYMAGYSYGFYPVTSGAYQTTSRAIGNETAVISKLAIGAETTDHFGVTIAFSVVPTRVAQGQKETLTATVTATGGSAIPTGSVEIFGTDLSNPLNPVTVALDPSGTATWTSTTLPAGTYAVSAEYSGDATHVTGNTLASGFQNQTYFTVVGAPASVLCAQQATYNFTYGTFSSLPLPFVVSDAAGLPLPGVTATFSGAGLTFSAPSAVSDANGVETANFTAVQAGHLNALATVKGVSTPGNCLIVVSPAPLTAVGESASRAYGATNPILTGRLTGLIGTDMVTVTGATPATSASPVGSYPVTAMVDGAAVSNYSVTYVPGVLEVRPAVLQVAGKGYADTYGQTPAPPAAFTLTGLVNGDTSSVVSGAPVLSMMATSASPVGYYPISVGVGTLKAANYSFAVGAQKGNFQVDPAPLMVIADNKTITQGQPIPELTYSYSGFVNGDTAATAVIGAPVVSTSAHSTYPPGTYPIVIDRGTLAQKNYAYTLVNGTLTILP